MNSSIDMKTLGVIKAVYNQEHLVEDIGQNIKDCATEGLRFYIRDDFSSDRTFEALKELCLSNTVINQNSENVGIRANDARLLAECATDYITFSAGDDFLHSEGLSEVMSVLNTESPDIVITKLLRVPESDALRISKLRSLHLTPQSEEILMRHREVFARTWSSATQFLETAAVLPGLVWTQGMIVRTDLAKAAGYLPDGDVDDWGLLHNLAVCSRGTRLKLVFVDKVFAVLGANPKSLGSDCEKQFCSQVQAVERFWDPILRKEALLNVVKKKVKLFSEIDVDADGVFRAFGEAFRSTSE